ncbi:MULTISPECIES: GNAT family N-acetyltransferase [Niastella]|uniref:GNAT family N-acetyltransferase n=1 Tax=Niastella soli TaxID=2821487 RepID=A0ABS3YXF1_9BACT|nr:GNAT family N-acetyltransferase [Niastella soli]MBO9202197.1 GNAT family N-acetyltransferase [Niastella soli]
MEQSVEITGQRGISLRSLVPANAPALAGIANDAAIAACIRDSFPSPYTLTNAQEFIQFAAADPYLQAWGIFDHNTLAGVISLTRQEDIYRHSAEIGYWLGTAFQGKGIITEAIGLACQHGFSQLNMIRIFAHVFETNTASRKALLKNGFVIEGIRKKGSIKNKVLLDDYLMAKLK